MPADDASLESVIILGLILVLLAVAAGILLFEGTSQLSDSVDFDVLGGTVSLPPLALLITGAAVISVFWLGWVLLRLGFKRSARRRRERKEEAALAAQRRAEGERRMQEEFAQRERQLAEERERHEQETAALRRQGEERLEEQHLSTEEARRRAEVAEARADHLRSDSARRPGDDTSEAPRGPGNVDGTRDPRT